MLNTQIKTALIASSIALAVGPVLPRAGYASAPQLAQAMSLEPQTISVTGQGKASVPATSAAVVFVFVSNSYPEYSEETGELISPAEIAEPADIQNVVDAVTAEGIAYDIEVSQESYDYQFLQMVVKLKNPTRDHLDRIRQVVAKTVLAEGKFSPTPAGIIYATDSCESLESAARANAITNAREQASLLAEASGLSLGGLSAIAGGLDLSYYGPSDTACPTDIDKILSHGSQIGFANYNGTRSPEVIVNFSVYATYAIAQ